MDRVDGSPVDPAKFVERVDFAIDAVAVDQRGCAAGQIGDAFQYGAPERLVQHRIVHRSDKRFSLPFIARRHRHTLRNRLKIADA